MSASALVTFNPIARTDLAQDARQAFDLPLERWKVWDARQTGLAIYSSASADDLGIYTGTHGTHAPHLSTGDCKNLTMTGRKAGITFRLPHNYVQAGAVSINVQAGMVTQAAATLATIEFTAYKLSGQLVDTVYGTSGQLVLTSATDINDLTWDDYEFALDARGLAPGDVLDIVANIKITDNQNITAVMGGFRGSIWATCRG